VGSGHLPAEEAAMEVVDAKYQAKVILKEIIDQHPGDHDLTAIWDRAGSANLNRSISGFSA